MKQTWRRQKMRIRCLLFLYSLLLSHAAGKTKQLPAIKALFPLIYIFLLKPTVRVSQLGEILGVSSLFTLLFELTFKVSLQQVIVVGLTECATIEYIKSLIFSCCIILTKYQQTSYSILTRVLVRNEGKPKLWANYTWQYYI